MGLPSAGHQAAWQPALCPAGLERETGLEDSNLEGSNVWLRIKVFETNFHSSCAFGITASSELKVNPAGKQHQPRPQSGIWGSTQWGRVWGWVFLSLKKKKKSAVRGWAYNNRLKAVPTLPFQGFPMLKSSTFQRPALGARRSPSAAAPMSIAQAWRWLPPAT